MTLRPIALMVLACGVLAACETPAPRTHASTAAEPAPPVSRPFFSLHSSGDDLAAYLAKLRGMNESALVAEAARQKRALGKDSNDLQRLRAAIALSLSPQGEDAEVLALAEPIARREGADANTRTMASFLVLFANERRRLRESASSARVALREEKKMSDTQKQRADALQERASQLQQKLDALSELEKSLSDRPPPAQ